MNNQNTHPFINAMAQVSSDSPSNIHILNMFNAEAAQRIQPAYAYQADQVIFKQTNNKTGMFLSTFPDTSDGQKSGFFS